MTLYSPRTFQRLAHASKSVRKNTFNSASPEAPISFLTDKVSIEGRLLKRTRLVLTAKPCKVGTCSMCPFPDEGLAQDHSDSDILTQVKNNLDYSGNSQVLTLFHNGNFFLESEISATLRQAIYTEVKKANYEVFSVESLPQTVSVDKINEFEKFLPGVKLEVAMGVQSMNEYVRAYCTVSPFKGEQLDCAIELLLSRGHTPRIFLMYGQPFLSPEESLQDTLSSLQSLKQQYGLESQVVVCPLGVQPHTLAHHIEALTSWTPPSLADVFELLLLMSANNFKAKIAINSSAQNYIANLGQYGGLPKVSNIFKEFNESANRTESPLINPLLEYTINKKSGMPFPTAEELEQRALQFLDKLENA